VREMSVEEVRRFASDGTRTAKIAVVREDGGLMGRADIAG
jgi:hypothetical protein